MEGYDSRFSPQSFEHFASSMWSFIAAKRSQDLAEKGSCVLYRICCKTDVRPDQKLKSNKVPAPLLQDAAHPDSGSDRPIAGTTRQISAQLESDL